MYEQKTPQQTNWQTTLFLLEFYIALVLETKTMIHLFPPLILHLQSKFFAIYWNRRNYFQLCYLFSFPFQFSYFSLCALYFFVAAHFTYPKNFKFLRIAECKMQKRWLKKNTEKSTDTINSTELQNSKRENKKKW